MASSLDDFGPRRDEGADPSRVEYQGEPREPQRFNPQTDLDIPRLQEAMDWSSLKLRPFRERYLDAVKIYAGNRYGDNTGLDKTPVNLMKLAVEIWQRQLVAQDPRSIVLTTNQGLKPSAYELQLASDHLYREIRLGETLAEAVRSAIFGMGIVKVGLTSQSLGEAEGYLHDAGQPYADVVLFDDWVHDMNARRPDEWDFCGNRYRLPLDVVKSNPEFKNTDKLAATETEEDTGMGIGYGGSGARADSLSRGDSITRFEFRPHVTLWDIWLPGDNVIVTLADGLDRPLRIQEWEGPEHGPFHILSFSNVPGNILPIPPAQQLYDLQELITRLFNKLGRQAARQKTLTIAEGKATEDGTAARVMEGEDGQVIRTSHADSVRELKYGGVDQGNLAFVVWLRELFSYMGGNIDAMGGLAQQAGTLGQEQLLVRSSSQLIQDMQTKVVGFAKAIMTDLSWYLYTDPLIELPLVKEIEGYGDIPFTWGPEQREADFFQYNFEVHPYSLQHKGPEQRLSQIMQLTQTLLLPLAPQLGAMGLNFNLQKLLELISKYGDMPELQELVTESALQSMDLPGRFDEGGGGEQRSLQSPVTSRNYTRQNVPTGGTQASRDEDMMKALISAAGRGGSSGVQ